MKWTNERKLRHSLMAKKLGYGKWMSGKKHTQSTKEKMSLYRKGKPFSGIKCDWNGRKHDMVSKTKMSKAKKGKKISDETRRKISKANRGEKSYFWKGGLTDINHSIRHSFEYRAWRKEVFKRDNYTCQICKNKNGCGTTVKIQADHIKPFSKYPSLRFDLSNGRTLCIECHRKTDTYGGRVNFKSNPRIEIEISR